VKILGLDISTSITGYTILDENFTIIKMGHIDFSKCKSFWGKADFAKQQLEALLTEFPVDVCYIEESLMSFSSGLSSAQTIAMLLKFNAMLSYFVRCKMGFDPHYVAANSARKTVGIKLLQKKKCGLSHKEQAFTWATSTQGPLAGIEFPKTKTGKFKPFVADEVDSYVVARAGLILNKQGLDNTVSL